jgi:hypothetical protein
LNDRRGDRVRRDGAKGGERKAERGGKVIPMEVRRR